MPTEAKPLFRPDVLRSHLAGFELPAHVDALRPKLRHWADLLESGKANTFKEQEILPDFLTDFFCELLGDKRPADGGPHYTISREKHIQVEGEFADAVLGNFGQATEKVVVALEGKGPKDPLDRPFAGRRMSAVDQGYRHAINLPCDWIIVTSIRQTRLYYKGTDQQTYERFDTEQLAKTDFCLATGSLSGVIKRVDRPYLLTCTAQVKVDGNADGNDRRLLSDRCGDHCQTRTRWESLPLSLPWLSRISRKCQAWQKTLRQHCPRNRGAGVDYFSPVSLALSESLMS